MPTNWLFSLTLIAALGSGLIAGVFFAFSSFVMKALSDIPPGQGIRAMQSINIVVLNPFFFTPFAGTALAGLALGVVALFRWGRTDAIYLLIASLLYVAGCFLVTILFNVPLNDALAAVEPESSSGAAIWARYLDRWVFWNHVRTAASFAGSAGFILALLRI